MLIAQAKVHFLHNYTLLLALRTRIKLEKKRIASLSLWQNYNQIKSKLYLQL